MTAKRSKPESRVLKDYGVVASEALADAIRKLIDRDGVGDVAKHAGLSREAVVRVAARIRTTKGTIALAMAILKP